MHHVDPMAVYQPRRVVMMHECSPGELLGRAAFIHHDDRWHSAPIKAGLCYLCEDLGEGVDDV